MRRRFQVSRSFKQPLPEVWRALMEPERLLVKLPRVKLARALAREADVAILEIELDRLAEPLTLEVVKAGPSLLSFSQVDRLLDRGIAGELEVRSDAEDKTSVDLVLHVPSRMVGWKGAARIEERLEAALAAFDTVSDLAPSAEDTDQRVKLLEVTRRGTTVEIWLRGKTTVLPTESE